MSEKIKILVVDDEPDILNFISYNLQKEGYEVSTASDGAMGIAIAKKELPELIILDIMMPQLDGIEVCKELRALPQFNNTLIVFLTARNEDYSQIAGFDAGGDDYISKPVRLRVLISRLKALLRRHSAAAPETETTRQQFGDLSIDTEKMEVYHGDRLCVLAKKEFELLQLLSSKPGKVFMRSEIFSRVWGADLIVGERTIDVHIRKLREKIGEDYIKTVKGIGYKFDF